MVNFLSFALCIHEPIHAFPLNPLPPLPIIMTRPTAPSTINPPHLALTWCPN